jgi:hypothetical protein
LGRCTVLALRRGTQVDHQATIAHRRSRDVVTTAAPYRDLDPSNPRKVNRFHDIGGSKAARDQPRPFLSISPLWILRVSSYPASPGNSSLPEKRAVNSPKLSLSIIDASGTRRLLDGSKFDADLRKQPGVAR